MTDASGFKYQLLEITEDMAAGTYMVQSNIDFSAIGDRTTDGRHIGPRYYPLDGWELLTFQVGTATEEEKVAGECTGCHNQKNFSTYRSPQLLRHRRLPGLPRPIGQPC